MTRSTDPAALDRDIQTGGAHYRLLVRSGDSWEELTRELAALRADRFVIVADDRTPRDLPARVRPEAQVLTVPCDTTLPLIEELAEQVLAVGATARTAILAVGGTTAGHAAGLLAALLFQGLRLVVVPTTLSAMCGSALSPRRSVSSGVLGSWYAPELIFCQVDLLDAEELRADLVEPIRHVLAICPGHYDQLAAALNPEAEYTPRQLASFIALCADARSTVTCYDPPERGPGRVLEYGRTIGRAIRLLAGGALSEGHADGLGMLVAARTAVHLGLLDPADDRAHRELLLRAGAPVTLPADLDPAALPAAVGLAAARSGQPGLVLLSALGQPHCTGGSLLTEVDDDALRAGVEALRPTSGVPHTRSARVPEPVES